MARPSPQTERLVNLVEVLAARPDHGLSLTELARHLDVTPATCHPMVTELTHRGWLRRHPVRRTYRLGPAFVALGRAAAGAAEAQELARAALAELRRVHKVDGLVLTVGADLTTIVDLVPDRKGSGLRIGDQVPLRAPLGAVAVAWADDDTVVRWLDGSTSSPELRRAYEELLAAVRARGYAVELTGTVDARIYELLAQLGGRFGDELADPATGRVRALLDELVGDVVGPGGFAPAVVDPDGSYVVGTMSAPVFDREGEATLLLAVRGRPDPVPGSWIDRVGEELVAAADEVTEASGGRRPRAGGAPAGR